MAHTHHEHRAHHVSRKRVGHIMKDGGHTHSDAAADKKLFKKLIAEHERHEHDVPGHKRGGRLAKYARGGAAKKHGTQVNIAVVAPHGRHPADAGAAPGGAMPRPPMGLPAGPPPGMPPALPPGGPPVGLGGPPGPMGPMGPRPPMKRGGRVKMTGGADTGRGRLEKIKAYGIKPPSKLKK